MNDPNTHVLEVWGDLACFTRPEMKVERFSYPVITPSAARGIFDAIYWEGIRDKKGMKPYFYWQIRKIEVLEPPRYIALRRNEVKEKISAQAVKKWINGEEVQPIVADWGKEELGTDQKGRTQRQTMALKNVRYRIHASIVPKAEFSGQIAKYNNMFHRRAARGQCYWQPYLGCREFPAYFKLAEDEAVAAFPLDQPLGWMLYDVFDLRRERVEDSQPFISLFDATVKNGVLEVPDFNDPAVRKPEGGA